MKLATSSVAGLLAVFVGSAAISATATTGERSADKSPGPEVRAHQEVKTSDWRDPYSAFPNPWSYDSVAETPWAILGLSRSQQHTACATSLSACPNTGCTDEANAVIDRMLNTMKNATPSASADATPLTWAQISEAQDYVDKRLNLKTGFGSKPLSAAERASLQDVHISSGVIREGMIVSIDGYLPFMLTAKDTNPTFSTPESCNCYLPNPNVDLHMNIAAAANDDAFSGIIVEVTPRMQHVGMTQAELRAAAAQHIKLRVTGQLLFDNEHHVRASSTVPPRGDPERLSLWEIHPITKIERVP